MPKRYRISLLNQDGRGKRKRFEPNLRLSLGHSTATTLRIEKAPREIRDQIYRYVFDEQKVVHEPRKFIFCGFHTVENVFDPEPEAKIHSDVIKKKFESDFVIDSSKAISLYRFPPSLLAEIETFVYDECTLKLECGETLFPREKEIVSRGKRLAIHYKGRPAIFVEGILPLLKNRHNLKYLYIGFTSWPGHLKAEGKHAARLLQRKLEFLAGVKAQNVVLDVYLHPSWKHEVLRSLADVMMGDKNVRIEGAAADSPVNRRIAVKTASGTVPKSNMKKAKSQGLAYTYGLISGRTSGFWGGSKFGSF